MLAVSMRGLSCSAAVLHALVKHRKLLGYPSSAYGSKCKVSDRPCFFLPFGNINNKSEFDSGYRTKPSINRFRFVAITVAAMLGAMNPALAVITTIDPYSGNTVQLWGRDRPASNQEFKLDVSADGTTESMTASTDDRGYLKIIDSLIVGKRGNQKDIGSLTIHSKTLGTGRVDGQENGDDEATIFFQGGKPFAAWGTYSYSQNVVLGDWEKVSGNWWGERFRYEAPSHTGNTYFIPQTPLDATGYSKGTSDSSYILQTRHNSLGIGRFESLVTTLHYNLAPKSEHPTYSWGYPSTDFFFADHDGNFNVSMGVGLDKKIDFSLLARIQAARNQPVYTPSIPTGRQPTWSLSNWGFVNVNYERRFVTDAPVSNDEIEKLTKEWRRARVSLEEIAELTAGPIRFNFNSFPVGENYHGNYLSSVWPFTVKGSLNTSMSAGSPFPAHWTQTFKNIGGPRFSDSSYADFLSGSFVETAHPRDFKTQPATGKSTLVDPDPQPERLPNDGYFHSKGSWGQGHDDQWGLKQVGFTATGRDGKDSLWPKQAKAVIVAVVDSGIDMGHPELQGALWVNFGEIPGNGKDDDKNGLVDDFLGWNFVDFNNDTRDLYGHGTFVAGIIAANVDNGLGIAGINPWARIMPVKVGNFTGGSDSVVVAQGITYAANMGARVINVSLGGLTLSKAERAAIEYANKKGALVVVAAGNENVDVKDVSPAGLDGAITVAAIDPPGGRSNYSNWGIKVDIAAPGTDILSLRARHTDLLVSVQKDYQRGSHIVGSKRLLYRTSGTSFSAPYVTGVASLLFSINPKLTATQVKRIILHSARDIDAPGVDRLTGYGLLDAAAALKADPEFFVEARIQGLQVVKRDGAPHVRVTGTADADQLAGAQIEIGVGDNPEQWIEVAIPIEATVIDGTLGDIPAQHFAAAKKWTVRIIVRHKNGRTREARTTLNLG